MVKFFSPLFLACLLLSFLSACSTNTLSMPTITPASTPSEYPILPDGLPPLETITVSNAEDLRLVKILQIPGFARSRISQCSVAFSPDGKLLSGVCYQNTVPLWDVQSGELLYSLQEKPSHEVAVAFSPDGTALAVGGFSGEIRIYDPATGKLTRTFEAWPTAIWDLDFDPVGNRLASIGLEVGMQFWDFRTGKQLWEYVKERGSASFLSVDVDPAGKTIAFGKVPGDVRIVEAETGQVINTLPIPANVGDVAFNPDGR
ncbi:MAG: PQQ-binding-like beta-propeller repeat protein, partial [Anaerolineales bacterium]|nr:PQQ-binding-like beta-propeller repeat protein [Anaerolineales bacterium]